MEKIKKPLITIIIPVFNGSDYIEQAINSALQQDYPNIEILVVDDGSTDNTKEIVNKFSKRVKYIYKTNGGVASALNWGIKESKGDYISWLSHDDIYLPKKISEQLKFISESKENIDVVFCDVEYIDQNSQTISITDYKQKYGLKKLAQGFFPVIKGLVNGCALLINKDVFTKVGLFNESLKTSNDYEMWFRIFRVCNVRYLHEVLIKYRLHQNQGTKTSPLYTKESNELWSGFINKLTEEDILVFSKSLFDFYLEIAEQMLLSNYLDAYNLALEKAEKEYKRTNRIVSIIMPVYNCDKYLAKAIDSVLSQTFKNFELIIVDDGSTDNTHKIISRYSKKDFRIKIFKNQKNIGIAKSMNIGISNAKGKYITRMDGDDILNELKIQKQVEYLDKNPECDICSTNIIGIDQVDKEITPPLYPKTEIPLNWLFLWKNPIPNAPTMYRVKSLVDKNFNSKYLIAEDYDFLTRNVLKTKPHLIEDVLYKYRIHEDSIFKRNTKEACINSIQISIQFAKSIVKHEVPEFHAQLTEFFEPSGLEKHNKQNLFEICNWMNKLLIKSQEIWNWTETEYKNAKMDAEMRILKNFSINQSEEMRLVTTQGNSTIKKENKLYNKIKGILIKLLNKWPYYKKIKQIEDLMNDNQYKIISIQENLLDELSKKDHEIVILKGKIKRFNMKNSKNQSK